VSFAEMLDMLMPLILMAAMLALFALINWLVDKL
jgi:hypothetical protein